MEQQLDIADAICDDVSIAKGLLGQPKIPPRRRASFTSTSASGCRADGQNDQEECRQAKEDSRRRRMIHSSNTWTSSSGEVLSDQDDIDDRAFFGLEYNRLAKKHGVRTLIPDDYEPSTIDSTNSSGKSGGWFSRKILRKTSSTQSVKLKTDRQLKHRRSISDLSIRLKSKRDTLKDKDLQELVRLCGLSLLYLPAEYAAGSLAVPTCFRATAQYLVQYASTAKGVFRIPGSHNIVAALYNHYCTINEEGEAVAGTVRCPTLPQHIRCDVHDVASAFKKFLSGLPGGILGCLPLFDAFVSIQNLLNSDPESTRTKQSKVRARLIALAIVALRSQYRRELICAVFGLLSMIGRAAEIAPRENDRGRPLPTSDLMGYGPLGIVFGPLLVGDLLDNYTMRLANPHGGLVLLPVSPPKFRKEKHKKRKSSEDCVSFNTHVDKIKVANSITEMLITHWRDVVRHMRNLKSIKVVGSYRSLAARAERQPFLRPSASESFALRKPPDWDIGNTPIRRVERSLSPTPACRSNGPLESKTYNLTSTQLNDNLKVRKQRSRSRPMSSQMLSGARSMSILSPTVEDPVAEDSPEFKQKIFGSESTPSVQSDRWNGRPSSSSTPKMAPLRTSSAETINCQLTGNEKPRLEKKSQSQHLGQQVSHLAGNQVHLLTERRLLGPRHSGPRHSEVTLSGVCSPNMNHFDSGFLRQISASEPGQIHKIVRSPPRARKSTFSDFERRNAGRCSWSKDPLSMVSHEEDIVSLAALAQVLEDEPAESKVKSGASEQDEVKEASPKPPPRETSSIASLEKPTAIEKRSFGHLSGIRPSSKKSNPGQAPFTLERPATCIEPQAAISQENPSEFCSTISHDICIANSFIARQSSQAIGGPIGGSPRTNVKAIAAKFNTTNSASLLSPSPTRWSSKVSPVDLQTQSDPSKEKLVAPYTTNPPSPAKSQKSGKSDLSLQSIRIAPPAERHMGKGTAIKTSPPRLLLRLDLKDPTPLRSARKSLEGTAISSPILPPSSINHGTDPLDEITIPPSAVGPENLRSSGAHSGITNVGTVLPLTAEPLVANQVPFAQSQTTSLPAEIVNTTPPISDTFLIPKAVGPTMRPPPTRSNSILHTQIRTLQRQLAAQTELLQQLKQQLDARANLDLGSLSEQLREAKREIQMWKTRTEVSEKQLEVMIQLSGRSNSRQQSTNSFSKPTHQSSAKYGEDGAAVADRIRTAFHGMDGAGSSDVGSSEESSDTVIRGIRDAVITGSEYSVWVEQTINAIDSKTARGLEHRS